MPSRNSKEYDTILESPQEAAEPVIDTAVVVDTAVAISEPPAVSARALPVRIDMGLKEMGAVFAASGFFNDARSQAQAIVKILAGAEQGIAPIASMQGIAIVEGKITYGSNLVAALVKRSENYRYKVREMSPDACAIEFFEREDGKWSTAGTMRFTIEDARAAGLVKDRSAWMKWPQSMCFARAMTAGARAYCPDIFVGGAYTTDEIGVEENDEGYAVVVSAPAQAGSTQTAYTGTSAAQQPQNGSQGQSGDGSVPFCSMNMPMSIRSGKNGKFWSCSHKVNGQYHNDSRDFDSWPERLNTFTGEISGGNPPGDISMAQLFLTVKSMGCSGAHIRAVIGDAYTPNAVLNGEVAQQPAWAQGIAAWCAATNNPRQAILNQILENRAAEMRAAQEPSLTERLNAAGAEVVEPPTEEFYEEPDAPIIEPDTTQEAVDV